MAEPTLNTVTPAPDSQKSLRSHFEQLQHAAYVAESLVSVIIACGVNAKWSTVIIKAAEDAHEVLAELGRGLDSVELDRLVMP